MKAVIPYSKSNSERDDTHALGRRVDKLPSGFIHYDFEEKLDISFRAEIAKLKAENKLLKAQLAEKEEFKKTAEHAAHDIRTPLSILLVCLKMCENLPEKERLMLRNSITSIQKITQEFLELSQNKGKRQEDQHILVSQALQDTVNQKAIQYNDKNIELKYSFDSSLGFTFIYGNYLNFERMMSNIINNSVEAFENKKGTVKIELLEDDKNVKITIQDNGKGMPPGIVSKLINGKSISTAKQGGFGIGTTQIQKTIREFSGKQFIESRQGIGTKITLTIPKFHCPRWFANKLTLNEGDVVVILDDDSSMFDLMKKVFESYLNDITLKFFKNAQDAIDFIKSFEEKDKLILLANYELRKQKTNGLDVIKISNIAKDRSILVTSAYNNKEIQEKIRLLETKIISKSIIENIEIVFRKEYLDQK